MINKTIFHYVWVYLNYDVKKQIAELSIWHSSHVGAPTLGLPTPHKYEINRANVKYVIKSEVELTTAKAAEIVDDIYNEEYGQKPTKKRGKK